MTNKPYGKCKNPIAHGRVKGEGYCRLCKKEEEE